MKRKLLSLALALALCLGLSVPAAAATITEIASDGDFEGFDLGSIGAYLTFYGGAAWVDQGAHGIIDTTGKVIVAPGKYRSAEVSSDGVAWAIRDDLWCIVDASGKELFSTPRNTIDAIYRTRDGFHDGLARVLSKENGKYGYIDETGNLVIPCEYDYHAGEFHDGLAVVYDPANAYYGYIDKTGKLVIPYQYTAAKQFVNGLAAVNTGNRWTVIDTTGKELLPQEYNFNNWGTIDNWAGYISSEAAIVRGTGELVFVNRAGQAVSRGFDSVYAFADGMARVKGKTPSLYGFVNEAGVLAIPFQYSVADDFCDGYAAVKIPSGEWQVIDKTGRVTGTYPNRDGSITNLGNGCFKISSTESRITRYGCIDYTGREIVSCKYAKIEDFSGGVAAVENFDGKWGFVDTTGAEIVPCKLGEVRYTNEPGIFVVKNFKDDNLWSIVKASGWTALAAPAAPAAPATPSAPAAPVQSATAAPTSSPVLVNGEKTAFDAYEIDGNNYFKLRDLAYVLSGTDKQFEVTWDGAANAIGLISGKAYSVQGGEMSSKGAGSQTAVPTTSKILLDGKEVALTAYEIGGNNYFKLRDIGEAFDFGVDWDAAAGTIRIDTAKGYTAN